MFYEFINNLDLKATAKHKKIEAGIYKQSEGICFMDTKRVFTDEEINNLARVFKILSEPSRLKIIRSISGEEKCVNTVSEETGLFQPNVSKHLKTLEKSKIVSSRVQGLFKYYIVTDPTILEICSRICHKS